MTTLLILQPIQLANTTVSDEHLARIVRQALEACRRDTGSHVDRLKRLKHAIDNHVTFSGFPYHPSKALTTAKFDALCDMVIQASRNKSQLLEAVLLAWVETEPDLKSAVRAELERRTIPLTGMKKGVAITTDHDFAAMVEQLIESNPNSAPVDIQLMIACLSGQFPGKLIEDEPETEPVEEQGEDDDTFIETSADSSLPHHMHNSVPGAMDGPEGAVMHWHRWLNELQELPAESVEWDSPNVESFVEAVRQLAEQKREERVSGQQRLQEAIEALRIEQVEPIEFHELEHIPHWHTARVEPNQTITLASEVERLHAMLAEDSAKRVERDRRKTYRERMVLQPAIDVLRGQIEQVYGELDALLCPEDISAPDNNDPTECPLLEKTSDISPENAAPTSQTTLDEADSNIDVQDVALESRITLFADTAVTEVTRLNESQETMVVDDPLVAPDLTIEESPGGTSAQATAASEEQDGVNISSVEIVEEFVFASPTLHPGTNATSLNPIGESHISVGATSDNMPNDTSAVTSADSHVEIVLPVAGAERVITASEYLLVGDSDEHWHAFLWMLVEADDVAAAYWIARYLDAANRQPPVAGWLLRAILGGRRVLPGSNRFVDDLLEITKCEHPGNSEVEHMLSLAAALGPSLFAPESGLSGWLESPPGLPGLHGIVNVIEEFASHGIALRPDMLFGAANAAQCNEQITNAARAARIWLEEEAPAQRTKYKRASDVWRTFIGLRGELRAFLSPVIEDQRDNLDTVQRDIERWSDLSHVNKRIDAIDANLLGMPRVRPIVGSPRNQLHRWVADACERAQSWSNLVTYERTLSTSSDWLLDQAMRLRAGWRKEFSSVQSTLIEIISPTQPIELVAAATCLGRAIAAVNEILEAPDDTSRQWSGAAEPFLPDARTLNDLLNARLLWIPELELDDEGSPHRIKDQISVIASALHDSIRENRDLRAALDGWIEQEDYRFCTKICEALDNPSELVQRWNEELATSRARLITMSARADDAIQQAIIDGVIDVDKATYYNAAVTSVHPDEVLNFAPEYAKLDNIHDELRNARRFRMEELRARWQELSLRLRQAALPAAHITAFVEEAFTREDTRVLEECIAHLAEALDLGLAVEERLFTTPETHDILQDFKRLIPNLEYVISRTNISPDIIAKEIEAATLADLRLKDVPPLRRQEAANAYKAWRTVKSSRPESRHVVPSLLTILTYLGLASAAAVGASSITIVEHGRDWLYAKAAMSASDMAKPIPQFGSEAKTTYHVIVLWERPGADTIAARLQELRLNLQNIIVMYLGRLTARQRQDVNRTAHTRELAIALLDELLLLFLAQERDARRRFPTFLRCALPFAYLNPYTPFKAGDVPPEMFFGREAMARELQREQGSCLVYGGRQLGKSALLRHVEREFHHPEREQYAWFEDIKLIGDARAGQPIETLWQKLRDAFKKMQLLAKRITTEKPEEIERYVQEVFEEQQDRRVLILFDEADNFLDADSTENFRVVERLRVLMMSTGRRFKVVFAGLHNVQRFQGIPNQPLAHFGTPICVGPLEANAARRLVQEPLEVLGYRVDASAVLRILSYTNYHPGLIQLLCQEVLRRVTTRASSAVPPYPIDQVDIEAVYRDAQVRERIRERFDWTLALDVRYQAIAWGIIWEQLDRRNSYAEAYPAGDLLRMMRGIWPNGFGQMELDRIRGLLDEMCGLGILVRNADGRYRLRSPNIVRLMGSERDIETHLVELFPRRPPQPYTADTYHTLLSDARPLRYSPLTHAQERALGRQQFGVGLLFASQASGLSDLPHALRAFLPRDLPVGLGVCLPIETDIGNNRTMYETLESQLQAYPKAKRIVIHYQIEAINPTHIAAIVSEAIEFCRRHQSHSRWVRVILIMPPKSAWAWFKLPATQRMALENQVDAVEWTGHWTEIGIQQRLAQHDMIHSAEACNEVYAATGGWPLLLDYLFDRCGAQDDPRPMARFIQQELDLVSSPLRRQFQAALGLDPRTPAYTVLQSIMREGQVPLDLIEVFAESIQLDQVVVNSSIEFLQRFGYVEGGETIAVEQTIAHVVPE